MRPIPAILALAPPVSAAAPGGRGDPGWGPLPAIPALATAVFPAAPEAVRPEIMIYAAASVRDALQEKAVACEQASGARLVFNFGASNDLARQIEAANKADLFISADESWMDKVAGGRAGGGAGRRRPAA